MTGKPDPSDLWFQAGGGTPDYDDARYRELLRQHWLPADSGFPDSADMNWGLLKELSDRPHPLVNNEWQMPPEIAGITRLNLTEMFCRQRNVHHLLDFVGVPPGYSPDTRAIDDRVLIAVRGYLTLHERLSRLSSWHERETGPAGTVGDYCIECGHRWPCDSRRIADGTYTDDEDGDDDA